MTAGGKPSEADGAPISARALIGRAVRWRGVRLGAVADVVLDQRLSRALGLEVACAGGEHRFLAAATYTIDGDVAATSPLALVEPAGLEFYRRRGTGIAAPRTVVAADAEIGRLADVLLDEAGDVREIVVEACEGGRRRFSPAGLALRVDLEGR